MRLQLTDDSIQSIITGLYHPNDVDFDAGYDTVALTISYGGVPATVVASVRGTHRDGRQTVLRAYPATVGPTDRESTESLRERRISPTEDSVEKYIHYLTQVALSGIEQMQQPYELKFYDPADEQRMSQLVGGRSDVPSHIETHLNGASDVTYAVGVDVSGVELWSYPVTTGPVDVSIRGHVLSDELPENVFDEQTTLPETQLDMECRPNIIGYFTSPSSAVPQQRNSAWIHVIGATVSNDDNPSEQRHLSDFMSTGELDFSPSHDALV